MLTATAGEMGDSYTSSGVPYCAIFPSRIRTTLSEETSASSRSWVTRIAVVPCLRKSATTSDRSSFLSSASSAEKGSSSRTIFGFTARARARATRVCWPPESSVGI